MIKEPSSPARRRRTLYDGPVSPTVGFVKGRVPHARDGHSATMI